MTAPAASVSVTSASPALTDTSQAAALLLKLYELRTEPELRRARAWFAFEFHPTSAREILSTWLAPGHQSAPYRMVTTYWDMAASFVVQGAISAEMFNAANTEHFALYAKINPFLTEVRDKAGYPDYLLNVERVVNQVSNVTEHVGIFARYMKRQSAFAEQGKQQSAYPEVGNIT